MTTAVFSKFKASASVKRWLLNFNYWQASSLSLQTLQTSKQTHTNRKCVLKTVGVNVTLGDEWVTEWVSAGQNNKKEKHKQPLSTSTYTIANTFVSFASLVGSLVWNDDDGLTRFTCKEFLTRIVLNSFQFLAILPSKIQQNKIKNRFQIKLL